MLKGVLAIASIGLTIFALADCIQCENAQLRGLPKWAWIVLIVLLPWVGPLTWLLVGKDRESGAPSAFDPLRGGPFRDGESGQPGSTGPRGSRGARGSRPLAPDEDPEFLRKLDEDIRRERRERERRGGDGDDGAAPDSPPADEGR
jgi:hypothetical protein